MNQEIEILHHRNKIMVSIIWCFFGIDLLAQILHGNNPLRIFSLGICWITVLSCFSYFIKKNVFSHSLMYIMTVLLGITLFVLTYTTDSTLGAFVNLLCLFLLPALANVHQDVKNVLLANFFSIITALVLMIRFEKDLFFTSSPVVCMIIIGVFIIIAIISILQSRYSESLRKNAIKARQKALKDKEQIQHIYQQLKDRAKKTHAFSLVLDKNMKSTNYTFAGLVTAFEEMSLAFEDTAHSLSSIVDLTSDSSNDMELMDQYSTELRNATLESVNEIKETQIHLKKLIETIHELDVQTSKNSHKYTQEIQSMIDESKNTSSFVQDKFSQIEEKIEDIAKKSIHIGSMIQQVNHSSHDITHNVVSISAAMEESHASLKEIQQGVVWVQEELEEISQSFEELSKISD